MLLLRSKRIFKKMLELDPMTGVHRELSTLEKIVPPIKVNGFFDNLDETLVAIYVFSGELFLMIGEKVINITEEVTVTVSGAARARQLRVSDKDGELVSIAYAADKISRFENDPTPFIENEDFDFGLFVSNIVTNAERRSVVLEVW